MEYRQAMMNTAPYRAALWIPRSGGSSVRLTSAAEAYLPVEDLIAKGEIRVGSLVSFAPEWSAYGSIVVVTDWKD
jgi:hypothetical protein